MSSPPYDAIVVGCGHNGLVCGAYLAKAGLRVLLLDRRERPGGAADTIEIAPGFRVPGAAHTIGRLRHSVMRDLGLEAQGLRLIRPEARAFAPQPDGRALTLWSEPSRTAEELVSWSGADADAYPRFDLKVRALGSFMAHLHAQTPPDLSEPNLADALTGLHLAGALRGLGGPANTREVTRVLPMAVADFVSEVFETEALRGAIAARGTQFTAMGPRAAGTTAVLLADSATREAGAAGQATTAVGGPGALAHALAAAARSAGAEIRGSTEVAAITSRNEAATGVALSTGEEIRSPVVVSGADPKHTLLDLLDPETLGPVLGWEASNIRSPGTVAKVNLALDGLPGFDTGGEEDRLHGRIVIGGGIDDLDRAFDAWKYGGVADAPYLEATIPSLTDPSLAPDGGHVMSVLAQWVPHGDIDGDEVGDRVIKRLSEFAPGLSELVRERQVMTPRDLEREYGLTEGHPFHAEPGLDQFFAWRPLLGLARYRLPLRGVYLCGAGAHPGGGITGAPGANAAREILLDLRRGRRR